MCFKETEMVNMWIVLLMNAIYSIFLFSSLHGTYLILSYFHLKTAVWQVRFTPRFIQLIFSSMLEVLEKGPFATRNVSDFLWGYEDPLIKMARDIMPPENRLPTDYFGFFYGVGVFKLIGLAKLYLNSSKILEVPPLEDLSRNSNRRFR